GILPAFTRRRIEAAAGKRRSYGLRQTALHGGGSGRLPLQVLRMVTSVDKPRKLTLRADTTSQSYFRICSSKRKSERKPMRLASERTARSMNHQKRLPLK